MEETCQHTKIVFANTTGEPLPRGGYEVDFLIRCHNCKKELFRVSEYGREIINLSKHQ